MHERSGWRELLQRPALGDHIVQLYMDGRQAVLLWLTDNVPLTAGKVLARAREQV